MFTREREVYRNDAWSGRRWDDNVFGMPGKRTAKRFAVWRGIAIFLRTPSLNSSQIHFGAVRMECIAGQAVRLGHGTLVSPELELNSTAFSILSSQWESGFDWAVVTADEGDHWLRFHRL